MSDRDTRDPVKTVKSDIKDTADELKHRTQAAGERAERSVRGNEMPLHEKLGSHVSETLHDAKAETDRAKRDVRHGED